MLIFLRDDDDFLRSNLDGGGGGRAAYTSHENTYVALPICSLFQHSDLLNAAAALMPFHIICLLCLLPKIVKKCFAIALF